MPLPKSALYIIRATVEIPVYAPTPEAALEEASNAFTDDTCAAARVMFEDMTCEFATRLPVNWSAREYPYTAGRRRAAKLGVLLKRQQPRPAQAE